MKKVFCIGVPVNTRRKAIPKTIPGIVFVIRAIFSIEPLNFNLLLDEINAPQ